MPRDGDQHVAPLAVQSGRSAHPAQSSRGRRRDARRASAEVAERAAAAAAPADPVPQSQRHRGAAGRREALRHVPAAGRGGRRRPQSGHRSGPDALAADEGGRPRQAGEDGETDPAPAGGARVSARRVRPADAEGAPVVGADAAPSAPAAAPAGTIHVRVVAGDAVVVFWPAVVRVRIQARSQDFAQEGPRDIFIYVGYLNSILVMQRP